ncbi:MAG TPA: FliA/WhiG family RNA polymerase sigma factor [Thermoleophilaceae bacterium]|nr:FliA/WhiG family RNA polymerase sigma factor [Thermoleophilaceae bacterium]
MAARNEDAQRLLELYKEHGDLGARDRLIMTYAPLAKYIVYKKIRSLPAHCDREDLISCALEALIKSIDRYEPARGTTLEQFAWTRIHGAVIDELRRQDWAPRNLRRMERDIAGARESFSGIYGRQPNENELAAAVGLTLTELRERRHEIASSEVTSLNSMVLTTEAAIERIDTLASTNRESDPEFAGAMSEAKAKFRRAFAALSEREREIAVLMYVKNMTLREIGQILGVSESRVCQIHGQLKHRLREALRRDADLFQEVA